MMRRRAFISLLGAATAAWPLAARAQKRDGVWRIAYLSATETPGEPRAQSRRLIMETALAQLGYIEGKNLVIERRLSSVIAPPIPQAL
jgi:putative ABC transport system substrate-binding protein